MQQQGRQKDCRPKRDRDGPMGHTSIGFIIPQQAGRSKNKAGKKEAEK